MEMVMLADTHGFHQQVKVPDGDILIFAGDVTMTGNRRALVKFADWANELPHKYKIAIAGNHDFCFKKYREESEEILAPIMYLEDEGVLVENTFIWGTPWTPTYGNWAFMRNENELAKIFDYIPQVDVLISHGPPRNMLDLSLAGHINCGSIALWRVPIPKIHVFGHIHEGYGTYMDADCTYINASIVNFQYNPVNSPIVMGI